MTAMAAEPAPRRRALIVEDEAPIRALVRLHLSLAGFDIEESGDGLEAVAKPST
jgi:DNA-binding response OmpR family regulator